MTRGMSAHLTPLPLVGRGEGVGGCSAHKIADESYRPAAHLTLPSPHKGERGEHCTNALSSDQRAC